MKTKSRLVIMTICLLALFLGGSGITAQERQPAKTMPGGDILIERSVETQERPGKMEDVIAFKVLSSEMRFGDSVVKGAPYSAKAIIERSQILSDGTHINHSSSVLFYRDGEGRTRRDETVGAIGPIGPARDASPVIFINDPVAGVHYFLDSGNKTAQKITLPKDGPAPDKALSSPGERVMIRRRGPGPEIGGDTHTPFEEKSESLGKQTIEGVVTEGTRTVMTIPVGQIGNDRPIEIVSEQWYSPALQAVVLSKHKDPRVGEHTYRLTNISLTEPDHSLFEVSSDYKVEEPSGGPIRRRRNFE